MIDLMKKNFTQIKRMRFITSWIIIYFCLMGCESSYTQPKIFSNQSADKRVITLSPHLGEMMFDIDAGNMLVGVSAYSNFPVEILQLPKVGDAFILDLEQIAVLQPDIILAWEDGTPGRVIDELRKLNYRVEVIKTSRLEDIPLALIKLGNMFDRQNQAEIIIEKYQLEIAKLKNTFGEKDNINVFFQIDDRPLFTIGGSHYISQLIELCGGKNIFRELPQLAPSVSIESVILRDPDAILSTDSAGDEKFDIWHRWSEIKANKLNNLYSINADRLERPTARIIKAGQEICQKLEESRTKYIS